mgnify:CR=1 FL=1
MTELLRDLHNYELYLISVIDRNPGLSQDAVDCISGLVFRLHEIKVEYEKKLRDFD